MELLAVEYMGSKRLKIGFLAFPTKRFHFGSIYDWSIKADFRGEVHQPNHPLWFHLGDINPNNEWKQITLIKGVAQQEVIRIFFANIYSLNYTKLFFETKVYEVRMLINPDCISQLLGIFLPKIDLALFPNTGINKAHISTLFEQERCTWFGKLPTSECQVLLRFLNIILVTTSCTRPIRQTYQTTWSTLSPAWWRENPSTYQPLCVMSWCRPHLMVPLIGTCHMGWWSLNCWSNAELPSPTMQ